MDDDYARVALTVVNIAEARGISLEDAAVLLGRVAEALTKAQAMRHVSNLKDLMAQDVGGGK